MSAEMPKRSYPWSDEFFLGRARDLADAAERDATELAKWSIDAAKIADFNAKIAAGYTIKPDEVLRTELTTRVHNAEAAAAALRATINIVHSRAEMKFGENSDVANEFRVQDLSGQRDDRLLWTAEIVKSKGTEYFAALAEKGLTQAILDDVTTKRTEYLAALLITIQKEDERRRTTRKRIVDFNVLYAIMKEISIAGKAEFGTTDAARYADYVLGTADDTPATTPGIPPGIGYASPNGYWQGLQNATSYDVEISTDNGVTTEQIATSITQLYYPIPYPAQGTLLFRVRAKNAAGVGEWSPWYELTASLSMPPSLIYLIDRFYVGQVPGATSYEMRYGPVGGNVEDATQVFDDDVEEYVWTPPMGTYTFYLRAKGANGLVSPWFEVVITIA